MSYGLRLFDREGNLRLDTKDRCLRFVATHTANRYADTAGGTRLLYIDGSNTSFRCHFVSTFNFTQPGMKPDGTWAVTIQKIPSPRGVDATYPANYLTAYPVIKENGFSIVLLSMWDYYIAGIASTAEVRMLFTAGVKPTIIADVYRA